MALFGRVAYRSKFLRPKALRFLIFIFAFGLIGGIIALILSLAATPIRVDNSLPQVRNLRAYPDDRVITLTWDTPQGAAGAGIVGYFVEYGETALGTFPYTKQTTYNAVQLQPVDNNKEYSVRVYAAHGSTVQVPTPDAQSASAPEKHGSGRVSPAVTIRSTPVSTRVDQLRQRMTGFFDDFNTPAGPFDELKWNQAGSSCGQVGTYGAFINNQHHSHNQVSTIRPGGADEYCDRGQMVTRARGVFDIAGRTDASPGEIVFDIDGAADIEKRSIWYLDLIPVDARANGAPVDVTAHASIFDDEVSDPMGIRIAQDSSSVKVHYYDINKVPRNITPTFSCMDWQGLAGCNAANKVSGLSPLAEPILNFNPIPNVRRHWVVHMTTSKMTIFIDSVRVLEIPIPADFRNITKYQLHSTIFGYSIGKDNPNNATTFLFHWDNFGFNGPLSPTVVHNYIEGGATGNTPYLGRGTLANPVPKGARTTIIPIPNQISTPVKARLHFTLTAFGPGWYTHSTSHNVRINGRTYPFTHPRNQVPEPRWAPWQNGETWLNGGIGNGNNPMAMSIDINPADLVTGNNQIQLNIDGHHQALMNVHIELEYNRGSQPSYTQPKDIFGLATVNTFNMPAMADHDKYLFIEQNLQLTGVDDGHGPHPDPGNPGPALDIRSFEAENGTFIPSARTGTDPNASGGMYLQF